MRACRIGGSGVRWRMLRMDQVHVVRHKVLVEGRSQRAVAGVGTGAGHGPQAPLGDGVVVIDRGPTPCDSFGRVEGCRTRRARRPQRREDRRREAAAAPRSRGGARELLDRRRGAGLLDCGRGHRAQPSALFALALDTGARKGELCGLRWADVDSRSRDGDVLPSAPQDRSRAGLRGAQTGAPADGDLPRRRWRV